MIEFDAERLRTLGLTPALANRAHAVAAERDDDAASAPLQLSYLTEVHRDRARRRRLGLRGP
jgi:hypothetical protein